jgi:hypothetical protein
MKLLLSATLMLFFVGAANAGLPRINATCPGDIDLHVDDGGPAYINGKSARLHKSNDNYYEVRGSGVTISIAITPDGSTSLSYTGKHGVNGNCTESGSSAAATSGAGHERHPGHRGESRAERACRKAVAHELGGNIRARDLRVIGSEESQAGTSVRVEAPGAEAPWACVVDSDGRVEDVYYSSEG